MSESKESIVKKVSLSIPRSAQACEPCRKGKRKCDGNIPCQRCVEQKKECRMVPYVPPIPKSRSSSDSQESKPRKRSSSGGSSKVSAAKLSRITSESGALTLSQNREISPLSNILLTEQIVDSCFMRFLAENFHTFWGSMFDFTPAFVTSEVDQQYSSVAKSVRADAVFATACRGLGMAGPANKFYQRALNNVQWIMNENTADSISAMGCLVLFTFGNDSNKTSELLSTMHSASTATVPSMNGRGLVDFAAKYIFQLMNPVSIDFHVQALLDVLSRVDVAALNIRSALQTLRETEEFPDLYPWDYAEVLGGPGALPLVHLTPEAARARLDQLDALEPPLDPSPKDTTVTTPPQTKLGGMIPQLMRTVSPELLRVLTQRFNSLSNCVRSVCLLAVGDLDRSRETAYTAIRSMNSVYTMMAVDSVIDLTQILDVSVSLRDKPLFLEIMQTMRRLAETNLMASILIRAVEKADWNGVAFGIADRSRSLLPQNKSANADSAPCSDYDPLSQMKPEPQSLFKFGGVSDDPRLPCEGTSSSSHSASVARDGLVPPPVDTTMGSLLFDILISPVTRISPNSANNPNAAVEDFFETFLFGDDDGQEDSLSNIL